MKILYGIQGTGNGHISRAREIIPHLERHGEVDLIISGTQSDVTLSTPVKYRKYGVSFAFGKKGGVDIWDTVRKLRPIQLYKDIKAFPVDDYDLVISDFEPISAWACKIRNKPCVALSHQSAFLSPNTPRPRKRDLLAEWIFRNYAPVTHAVGFHFERYDQFIHPPVIRKQIRDLEPTNEGHITVYLPAYADQFLLPYLLRIREVKWEVFSKHCKKPYTQDHVTVSPINNEAFNKSLASSSGALLGGGFEGPAEALYLGKKLFVIPMINQYEQVCNALAARKLGVTVISEVNGNFINQVKSWLEYGKPISVNYPDLTAGIIDDLVASIPEIQHGNPHLAIS